MPKLSKPIKTPSIRATMRAIPAGKSRSYAATDLGDFATVRVAASKLNAIDDYDYKVTTPDNGATITITKQPKQQ